VKRPVAAAATLVAVTPLPEKTPFFPPFANQTVVAVLLPLT
jgi:hypothetical protein